MLLSVIVTVFISLKVDDLLLSLATKKVLIMPLKNLSHFTAFNASQFFSRKELRFLSTARWVEKTDTGSEVEKGVKVSLLIYKDNSEYPNNKTNLGEKIMVKVPFASIEDYSAFQPMITPCEVTKIEKAVVYGEYRNQLSLTASVSEVDETVEL
jgi:hypothetical protein